MLNGLDLFSGIGGFSLALRSHVRVVAYCERDPFCQAVLLSRMWAGDLDAAPIWDDVKTLDASLLPEIDIITGGFPCQDLSVAGHGRGLEGERSGLFFEIIRLVREVRPRFVFLENVPAVAVRGLDRIVMEFTQIGYDCRWTIVSAAEVGAVHIRERWFLLAHANGVRLQEERGAEVGRSYAERARPLEPNGQSSERRTPWASERLAKPNVDRTGDGIPQRVDRHRGLGNAVVPSQAQEAFNRLIGIGA